MYQHHRVRVKTALREDEMLPSITGIHAGGGWYEREFYDMFGILFSPATPTWRRLLTDYGFRGHPLRKDFPTPATPRCAMTRRSSAWSTSR